MDLIVLIFLTRHIGQLARGKGVKAFNWKLYTVLSWILTEFMGVIVGFVIFGKDNLISVGLVGFAFAITSYFIIKAQLNKLPDQNFEDDINNLGSN